MPTTEPPKEGLPNAGRAANSAWHELSEQLALSTAPAYHHPSLAAGGSWHRVIFTKGRVPESRTPGSVRTKAQWLIWSTVHSR